MLDVLLLIGEVLLVVGAAVFALATLVGLLSALTAIFVEWVGGPWDHRSPDRTPLQRFADLFR